MSTPRIEATIRDIRAYEGRVARARVLAAEIGAGPRPEPHCCAHIGITEGARHSINCPEFPPTPPGSPTAQVEHSGCREFLRAQWAGRGIDVHVAAVPPIVPSPFEEAPFTCPHGVTYWCEPTSEQIAQWAADGVA